MLIDGVTEIQKMSIRDSICYKRRCYFAVNEILQNTLFNIIYSGIKQISYNIFLQFHLLPPGLHNKFRCDAY